MKEKNVLLRIFSFILGVCICCVSIFHDNFQINILSALLATCITSYCFYKKVDLNDPYFYSFLLFFVLLSFALSDLSFRGKEGVNLSIYLCAYLIGSIPFGLVLAQKFAHIDIQSAGSKSIGATNVLRVVKQNDEKLAKKLAIATLALDFLKAFALIMLASFLDFDENMLYSIGVLVVLGHCYSLYLGFEGGKGVATAAGVMAALMPLSLLVAVVCWFIVGKVFKISSLASLVALFAFLVACFVFDAQLSSDFYAPIMLICVIIVYKHLPNIKRLVFKQECKVI